MSQSRNILLITDIFPSDNYTGGVVTQQLCYFLLESKCNLFCALVKNPSLHEKPDDIIRQNITTIKFLKPTENSGDQKTYNSKINQISQKIITFIKKNHIDTVWCPIQGESLTTILYRVQQKCGKDVRIVAQIWDPVDWFLYALNYDKTSTKRVLKLFDSVMEQCDFILSASHPMSATYKKKYHTPTLPMFSSYYNFNPNIAAPKNHSAKQTFTITLSGQTYAKRGIKSLITALDSMDWNYHGKEINLQYFGPNNDDFLTNNPHISVRGYVPQDTLIAAEAESDLLYCPYYFDDAPVFKLISEQSYPSKISTYIPSGTPILIHSDSNTSVYRDFRKHKCGFLLNSTDTSAIIKKIQEIIDTPFSKIIPLVENANKLYQTSFTKEQCKKTFFKALNIKYNQSPSYHILEVNNIDLPGKRWNGYDLTEYLNTNTPHLASQIVTYKQSKNPKVTKILTRKELLLEEKFLNFEEKNLSVHSCLSCSSPAIQEKSEFKKSDVIHLHLIHNLKFSLISLIEICNKKPTIITIHDPWTFTGRCVWTLDCKKYLTGCHNCPNLNTLFPLKCDNCHELWQLKKLVYDKLDVDYVVTTKYMYDLFKNSPLTKGKRIHVIPFGINVNEFYKKFTSEEARKHYQIPKSNIVLFHRAQKASKGTNYLLDALKELNVPNHITIITCSETSLLNDIKDKYQLIELGETDSEELAYAYNACDIYVMPSIGESFGMMAIEAMSCEKPVIVFDNTALPSVTFAPKCGVAVKDRDSHELMKALKWLIEDESERIRRGKLGRELVIKNYDIDVYHQRITELYEEVAKRKHKFYDFNSFFFKEIKNTPSVVVLKRKLNSLTNSIFEKYSPERNQLKYVIPKRPKSKTASIKYGDENVQLLLNQYNNAVFNAYHTYSPETIKRPLPAKILHKGKTLLRLIIHNPSSIIEVIRKKSLNKSKNKTN